MIKKIDHIGIAVNDLDKTLSTYKKAYGLEATHIETVEVMKVKIAFIPIGEVMIELIAPTDPGAGIIGQFLKEKGEGIHHVGLGVDNIEDAIEKVKGTDMGMMDKTPRQGAHDSRIAFIEPAFTQNVLTELVERRER